MIGKLHGSDIIRSDKQYRQGIVFDPIIAKINELIEDTDKRLKALEEKQSPVFNQNKVEVQRPCKICGKAEYVHIHFGTSTEQPHNFS